MREAISRESLAISGTGARREARTVYAGSRMNLGWSVTSGGTKQSELHTSATRHAGTLPRRRARPSQMGSEAAPDE